MICVGPKRLFEKSGNERFDQCRATSEDATITLSLLKSIMPIFMWIPFQAAMETFQTASQRLFEKSGNERFDQCRATSEDATITLSLLKSIMPIFMWIPFQAAMETFQTASKKCLLLSRRGGSVPE